MVLERAGVELARSCLGADERIIASIVEQRATVLVRAALRHHVDPGTDEIALAYIIGRDVDLDLLQRIEGDRCDVGTVAGFASQPERIVEVRSVHRHVVQEVVLTGE